MTGRTDRDANAERFDRGIDAVIEMNATIDGELATCQKDRDEGRVELREVLLDLGATQEQIDAKFAAVDAKDAAV